MGKYDPLREYLARYGGDRVTLSFAEVERLVGRLPASARNYRAWWANDSKVEAQAWLAAGWRARSVNLTAEIVEFVRNVPGTRAASRPPEQTAGAATGSEQEPGSAHSGYRQPVVSSPVRRDLINDRLRTLLEGFADYVAAYDELVPFTGEQLAAHRETIALRRRAGSVRAAVSDRRFVASLRRTLSAWGIGGRASYLVGETEFARALDAATPALERFEALRIDAPDLPSDLADRLWRVIEALGVVENKAKLVAGTKTLHHLVPDLMVPMDRAWTGKFFQLHPPEWQEPDSQRRLFRRVYGQLAQAAQRVQPQQFVTGKGWRTSRTKILDNALIGFCKMELEEEAAAPTADRMSQVSFEVPDYPPAKSEALSMLGSDHPHARRVRALLEAAREACRQQAFVPIESGHVALDVVLCAPTGEAQSDATNYLGGVGDVLEDKSHRGMLNHLGDLAAVWLYRNDRQIKQVSYRETEASQPTYTVTVRKLGNP